MATTTPNFSWPVPTSTDLVKDGATAIESLGDAIDASLVDLKGGTTGQVLSKASGTDMDFTWVTADDTNAIQNAIVDAKGDLIAATAADTPARLAVGTDGQVLTADSTAATGLKWNTAASGALVKITSQSFSASSAVNVNDVFSATYKNYKVMLNLTSTAAGIACAYRFRVSGADNSTSNYATQFSNATGGSVGAGLATGQTSGGFVDIKNVNSNQEITFFNPFATELSYAVATGNWEAASPIYQVRSSGFNATTSFTGFTIIPASGTITGSLIVYGLAD